MRLLVEINQGLTHSTQIRHRALICASNAIALKRKKIQIERKLMDQQNDTGVSTDTAIAGRKGIK